MLLINVVIHQSKIVARAAQVSSSFGHEQVVRSGLYYYAQQLDAIYHFNV